MSLIDRAIRAGARPRSFWAMFAVCLFAPVAALPYLLLVNYGFVRHTFFGFLFFFALILVAAGFFPYYVNGMLAGRYRDLKGLPWSELPW